MKTVLSLLTTVLLALSHQVYGQGVTITDWMIDMLDEVNAERATAGTHALCYNDKVILAAEVHNQDMVNNSFFSHTGSDGSQPWHRLATQGYPWSAVGENVAFGQTTVTQVMNSWMNSEGHRGNILNSDFYHFGVAWDTTTNKWTQVFGNSGSESCMTLTPCADRVGAWTIHGKKRSKTKPWCIWARRKRGVYITERCAKKQLYVDCPVTCGTCPP